MAGTVKHTPGPWIWGDEYRGLYGAGPDNEILSYASYENMWLSHAKGREANARLIAASPDLLAALQALCVGDVSYHDGEIRIPLADHAAALTAMRVAREAIAKAEGQS